MTLTNSDYFKLKQDLFPFSSQFSGLTPFHPHGLVVFCTLGPNPTLVSFSDNLSSQFSPYMYLSAKHQLARVCEICEPASHASHRASHASHASHSANVKNFYLFYLHSREKILDEFFSLFFFFFRFCYNFGENFAYSKSPKMRNKIKTVRKNLLRFKTSEKKSEKNIRLHRYSNRYLLIHVIH